MYHIRQSYFCDTVSTLKSFGSFFYVRKQAQFPT